MCEPVTIMTSLAIASSAISAAGAQAQAQSQTNALATQRRAQAEEISTQKSLEAGERVKQARAERSRLRVAAGEAGVTGVSFEDMLSDSFTQQDHDLGVLAKDASFAQRGSEARYQSGLASIPQQSGLESGLQIASAGYGGYQSGLAIKERNSAQ